MSIEIMSRCWKIRCVSHTQKLVLIALADNANDQGICWPSIDYLAAKCDLSRQGVIDQISKLEEKGLLKVRKTSGRSNIYEVVATLPTGETGQPHGRVNPVDESTRLTSPVVGFDHHQSTGLTFPVNGIDSNRKEPSGEASLNHHKIPQKEKFIKPTLTEVKMQAAKTGLPETEAEKFFDYYSANGWRVGRNPMRSFPHAVANWKRTWEERRQTGNRVPEPRQVRENIQIPML